MRKKTITKALPFVIIMLAIGIGMQSAPGESPGNNETTYFNGDKISTSWNLSYIFSDQETASGELSRLNQESGRINQTYRPEFDNLTGPTLLHYVQDEKAFEESLDVLYGYAFAQNSLNVNEPFFENLLSDVQNLSTDHYADTSFVELKLKSLPSSEWEEIFGEEPGLAEYKRFLEDVYIRYADHKPRNESHAAYLADLGNQLVKLETEASKKITNNVTVAGNITLTNGEEIPINSQTYYELLFTDTDRNNRKKAYDKRFYHLINESDMMTEIYSKKAKLDDLVARELNYSDSYDAKMFRYHLTEEQIDEMNSVFKERKGVFDDYYELRREKMGLDQLMPYDIFLQLMKDPGKRYNYTDALAELQRSYGQLNPEFNEIFLKTVVGGYVDVYPNPDSGKMPIGYCMEQYVLGHPSLIFMNYKGLINDKKTLTHEMGHAFNDYLMGSNLDYLYCGGTQYELEIPSTFNEELLVDYAVNNYDKDTAVAVLADHVGSYDNLFSFQPLITEFEREAHQLIDQKDNVSGAELNSLWESLDKEYRSDMVGSYDVDSARWTYINHIFFTGNYYTFNYALSEAITLSLFKKYKENPDGFNQNYMAYLSAGTTMTPPVKLKKFFSIEINRQLFQDAMDVVEMRVKQLEELERSES